MSGARVALPTGGNPAASGLVNFQLADSAGAGVPHGIIGFSVSETGGSSSVSVRLHDGTSSSAPILHPKVTVPANGDFEFSPPSGVQVQSGSVYAEVSGSGSAELIVLW